MLRFGDCDISEENAKTSAQRKNANLTSKNVNLTYAPNRLLAGASPQTPLGELTAFPQTP